MATHKEVYNLYYTHSALESLTHTHTDILQKSESELHIALMKTHSRGFRHAFWSQAQDHLYMWFDPAVKFALFEKCDTQF